MKCRACPKAAVLHITEVREDDRFDELHFCEDCGRRYLYAAPESAKAAKAGAAAEVDDDADDYGDVLEPDAPDAPVEAGLAEEPDARPCEACGIKFVEFRNSGRLGCPHDYDHFRDDLLPLLESIHGDTAHAGKSPKSPARTPPKRAADSGELAALRKKLTRAVKDEDYEAAARLRDRIRELEAA